MCKLISTYVKMKSHADNFSQSDGLNIEMNRGVRANRMKRVNDEE